MKRKGDVSPALIHHDGALGDLLLSLPAIRIIRERADVVHIAGRADAVRFLRDTGVVEKAIPSDHPLFLSLYGCDPDDSARAFISSYDAVFIFTKNGASPLAESLGLINKNVNIILTIPPEDHPVHCADYRMQQLDLVDAYTLPTNEPRDDRLRLQQSLEALRPAFSCNCAVDPSPAGAADVISPLLGIPDSALRAAREFLAGCGFDGTKPFVAIHPGSGGKRKCWPTVRFLDCLEHLQRNAGVFPVIVTGPADEGIARVIEDFRTRQVLQAAHARNLDLVTLAALLADCRLFIGNDSGISHLASVVNGNVVAVFGPTDPRVWRPAGKRVRVVTSNEPCAPCGDEGSRICSERACLESISVDRVLEEAGRVLQVPNPDIG